MDGVTDRAMGGASNGRGDGSSDGRGDGRIPTRNGSIAFTIINFSQRELAKCLAADRKMYSRDVNGDGEGNRESGDGRQ